MAYGAVAAAETPLDGSHVALRVTDLAIVITSIKCRRALLEIFTVNFNTKLWRCYPPGAIPPPHITHEVWKLSSRTDAAAFTLGGSVTNYSELCVIVPLNNNW
jgi:hypothetical protein